MLKSRRKSLTCNSGGTLAVNGWQSVKQCNVVQYRATFPLTTTSPTRRGHSTECKLTPATWSPSTEICFCTLWPCDLDLWPFDLILNSYSQDSWWTIPVASLVIVVSAVLVIDYRADRDIVRHAHRQTSVLRYSRRRSNNAFTPMSKGCITKPACQQENERVPFPHKSGKGSSGAPLWPAMGSGRSFNGRRTALWSVDAVAGLCCSETKIFCILIHFVSKNIVLYVRGLIWESWSNRSFTGPAYQGVGKTKTQVIRGQVRLDVQLGLNTAPFQQSLEEQADDSCAWNDATACRPVDSSMHIALVKVYFI